MDNPTYGTVGRMKCIIRDCPNDATTEVTIRLPKQWDDTTVIADEIRDQRVQVSNDHARLLSEHGMDGISIEPKSDPSRE